VKKLGSWVLGIVVISLAFGAMGFCQWGYGEVRTKIPGPLRILVGGEREFTADEYFNDTYRAFVEYNEEYKECEKTRDQECQTKAYRILRDRVGDGVPAAAGHMSPFHKRLKNAIDDMYDIHLRVEKGEQRNANLVEDASKAAKELQLAMEEWIQESKK